MVMIDVGVQLLAFPRLDPALEKPFELLILARMQVLLGQLGENEDRVNPNLMKGLISAISSFRTTTQPKLS